MTNSTRRRISRIGELGTILAYDYMNNDKFYRTSSFFIYFRRSESLNRGPRKTSAASKPSAPKGEPPSS